MAIVYLGIGSNIGDKKRNLEEAVRRLGEDGSMRLGRVSGSYSTLPAGGPPQDDYLNAVVEIRTEEAPEKLLEKLKGIERSMGRRPSPGKDHPRVIDLDILLYGDVIMNTGELSIPHPRMHVRAFVLKGLAEIAPEVKHPVSGRTAEQLYLENK